jgi:tetratricopeptide (TPR) repeat protein
VRKCDYRLSLETRRRVLGNEHPETLTMLNNLATLLKAEGRLTEAETYMREALETRRRVLGDEHPDTIASLNNLGTILLAEGKPAEAETYCGEAVDAGRRVLGDAHPNTLYFMNNLGDVLRLQGRPAEAIELLAPAEPAARRVFTGSNAVRLGRFLLSLGSARAAAGAFEAAEANLNEVQTIFSAAKGVTDGDHAKALSALIDLYEAWDAAEPDNGHAACAAEWRAARDAWNARDERTAESP